LLFFSLFTSSFISLSSPSPSSHQNRGRTVFLHGPEVRKKKNIIPVFSTSPQPSNTPGPHYNANLVKQRTWPNFQSRENRDPKEQAAW
jgi:hypothetical protein